MTYYILLPVIRAALPAAGGEGFPSRNRLLEKFGMGAGTDEDNRVFFDSVDNEEIPADMTFTMVGSIPLQPMIQPFRAEWRIIRDQQENDFLQSHHIITTRTVEPLPILEEPLGKFSRARRYGAPRVWRLRHQAL